MIRRWELAKSGTGAGFENDTTVSRKNRGGRVRISSLVVSLRACLRVRGYQVVQVVRGLGIPRGAEPAR